VRDGDEEVVVVVRAGDFDGVDVLREEHCECDDEYEADDAQRGKHDGGPSAEAEELEEMGLESGFGGGV